jgi:hypothetical protein
MISLGIHASQGNLGVMLCQEVKQQLLVWIATGHVVNYDSGLSVVSSLDPKSLQDSQICDGCLEIDLTECYCIDLNLQYCVDISNSRVHIRHLRLIKLSLYNTRMPILFVYL